MEQTQKQTPVHDEASSPAQGRSLELLQFTDLHLVSSPQETLWDINTYQTFKAVFRTAVARHPSAELALFTGDLVHEPNAAAYQLLRESLAELEFPVYRLPGNHDDIAMINQWLTGGSIKSERMIRLDRWQIILLDSNAPADHGGRIDHAELEYLENCLSDLPDCHALICLHHHPVPIKSPWMDAMALENPQDLFQVLDRYAQVRGVIWGHIHQEFNSERHGVRLLGAPSTSIQFAPFCDRFVEDDLGPGYRWLRLHPDGRIETEVHYLSKTDFQKR